MLKEGQKAPDFNLPSSDGGHLRLADLRGKRVVLYFYPRDNTPGCTREACAFRDDLPRLRRRKTIVLGISPDSVESHARFRDKHGLNFPLLADVDKSVARRYGAFGKKTLSGKAVMGMIRSTFVIDELGIVRKIFPKVKVDEHVQEVLEALAALAG